MANMGYTDAYFPTAFVGPPSQVGSQGPILHSAGEPVPLIPQVTASLHLDYSYPVGWWGAGTRVYGRADYRWMDRLSRGDPRDEGYNPVGGPTLSESYGMLNLRAGIRLANFDISAFVDNLTNSDPALQLLNRDGTNYTHAVAIRPRTAGITALYSF